MNTRKLHMAALAAFLLVIGLATSGCKTATPTPADHGIPNFRWLDKDWGICAGGQPTLQGWYWLSTQSAGQSTMQGQLAKVNHVIKLNSDDEGSDAVAYVQLGMAVDKFPINTRQQLDPTLRDELDAQIHQSLHMVAPGTFIHCEHGQDRTGAFVYAYRRDHGWTDAQAREEMMTNGFHSVLLGLKRLVDEYKPELALPYKRSQLSSPKGK